MVSCPDTHASSRHVPSSSESLSIETRDGQLSASHCAASKSPLIAGDVNGGYRIALEPRRELEVLDYPLGY